jgi:hypothetical protein
MGWDNNCVKIELNQLKGACGCELFGCEVRLPDEKISRRWLGNETYLCLCHIWQEKQPCVVTRIDLHFDFC